MAEIRGNLSPWYRVCTNAIVISKGSYGNGESKNVILVSVEKAHLAVRTCKVSGFIQRLIGPPVLIGRNSRQPSPWYHVCTFAIVISKGSYGNGEFKNVILVSVQKAHLAVRTCKVRCFMHRCIGPLVSIFGNSGLPFAMVPCLHQSNRCFHDRPVMEF